MDLSPKTKVNDLLAVYPFLKDFLISLNPEFKMLDNAFLRKTVGKLATLGKAAMISGMDVDKLIDAIAGEIKKKTGQVVSVSYDAAEKVGQDDKIDAMK